MKILNELPTQSKPTLESWRQSVSNLSYESYNF